jgi:heme-degrading monooxygenase HmoA
MGFYFDPSLETASSHAYVDTKTGALMTIRVVIKRHVKEGFVGRVAEMLQEFRNQAKKQPGYISGETWINHYDPRSITIVSAWQHLEDWIRWQSSDERAANEAKLEGLLEVPTKYEIYDVGRLPERISPQMPAHGSDEVS